VFDDLEEEDKVDGGVPIRKEVVGLGLGRRREMGYREEGAGLAREKRKDGRDGPPGREVQGGLGFLFLFFI
jgi:hypothetical protein